MMYQYSDQGRLLRESVFYYDTSTGDYSVGRDLVYHYNTLNLLIKKEIVDGLPNHPQAFIPGIEEEFKYNSANVLIESVRYDPYAGNTIMSISRFYYN